MANGYANKFLDIDLSSGSVKTVSFPEETLRRYLGGRGLAARILWDRLGDHWHDTDPLGPDNILTILTGPLVGYYPGGRLTVSGKSPQTNGIVGSTVGGEAPIELRCSGYEGLIVAGRAEKPSYIFINDDKVEIRDAKHLWGKMGKETVKILTKEIREELKQKKPPLGTPKEPAILYVGPAGEKRSRIAAVMHKWAHGAGYGGYGGVMGSKNLKAVVAKGNGPIPPAHDAGLTRKIMDDVIQRLAEKDEMRRYGTGSAGYTVGADTSSEPIRNWQEEWHDNKEFGVDKFERRVWIKRYWGDYGCPTTCLKLAMVKTGPLKGAIGDNPDYELQAYQGTNLGIFTPEGSVYLSTLADELGLCGIQGGNMLGFAGELYQRGILTREDLGGIGLKWGDPIAFGKLAKKIARRQGIGDLLAEGTYRAAKRIGEMKKVDVMPYAVQGKGMALGAHGIRSALDYVENIGYPCGVQGPDHTSVPELNLKSFGGELGTILEDSAVTCMFNRPKGELILDMLNAVTGWNMTVDEWFGEHAQRIAHIQRAALLIGGPDAVWRPDIDDDVPPRFYEPLPSGPKKGQAADKAKIEEEKHQYFKLIGWDERGIPRSDVLHTLGLDDVDRALEKVRAP